MRVDPHYHEGLHLSDEQEVAWQADIAALQEHANRQELAPLLMGDFFNECKARWGQKVGALAREAGVSPLVAWKYAHTARHIPPGHAIRSMSLPYSILRMIAPLPNPLHWAEVACEWREERRLNVREFAALLVDCGHRNQRVRHVKYCLHCEHSITPGADANNVQIVQGQTRGWLCGPRCVCAYFAEPSPPLPSAPPRDTDPYLYLGPETDDAPPHVPAAAPAAPAPESRDTPPTPGFLALSLSRSLTLFIRPTRHPSTRLRVSSLPRRKRRDHEPPAARSHPRRRPNRCPQRRTPSRPPRAVPEPARTRPPPS